MRPNCVMAAEGSEPPPVATNDETASGAGPADDDAADSGTDDPHASDADPNGASPTHAASAAATSAPSAPPPSSSIAPSPDDAPAPANPGYEPVASLPTPPPLDAAESRVPAPTAAYAVPLSLVASVILAAGGVSFCQRRKLRAERAQEHALLAAARHEPPLSRRSTLSWAGFVALGRGPAPTSPIPDPRAHTHMRERERRGAQLTASRSTSVSTMRAWRRDVSRYHGAGRAGKARPLTDDDGEDTYVDNRSVSSASHRAPAPRRTTREPFDILASDPDEAPPYHRSVRARAHAPSRVAAGVFRAMSPAPDRERDRERAGAGGRQYSLDDAYHEDEEWARMKRKARAEGRAVGEGADRDEHLNAAVTDAVVSRYLDLSPVPLSPAPPASRAAAPPPWDVSVVARPERLHVRRCAEPGGVGRERGARGDSDVPPPLPPKDYERDLYDAVARRLSGRPRT